MKKILLFIILHIFCLNIHSQEAVTDGPFIPVDNHIGGEVIFELSPNLVIPAEGQDAIAGGMNLQIFVFRKVSLNGNLVIGKDYLHFGPGIIAMPVRLLSGWMRGDFISVSISRDDDAFRLWVFIKDIFASPQPEKLYHAGDRCFSFINTLQAQRSAP